MKSENHVQARALIADDEPLLRDSLVRLLNELWPELVVVAQVRNGREAIEAYFQNKPDICFLDVHMPGLNGIEAARAIGRNPYFVFVTAYTDYAVQAFEQGALDYVVKPLERERFRDTLERIQQRLSQQNDSKKQGSSQPAIDFEDALDRLQQRLGMHIQEHVQKHVEEYLGGRIEAPKKVLSEPEKLKWIKALVGQSLKLIEVSRIEYFRSDEKYTAIVWRDENNKLNEALIRSTLRELLSQLDANDFIQIHRAVVVNLHRISHVIRADNDTATVYLKDGKDTLPVSRSFLHYFKHM